MGSKSEAAKVAKTVSFPGQVHIGLPFLVVPAPVAVLVVAQVRPPARVATAAAAGPLVPFLRSLARTAAAHRRDLVALLRAAVLSRDVPGRNAADPGWWQFNSFL